MSWASAPASRAVCVFGFQLGELLARPPVPLDRITGQAKDRVDAVEGRLLVAVFLRQGLRRDAGQQFDVQFPRASRSASLGAHSISKYGTLIFSDTMLQFSSHSRHFICATSNNLWPILDDHPVTDDTDCSTRLLELGCIP